MAAKREYTPEETAAYNERKQAEMEEMIKRIDEGVQSVFESERYKEYLKFVSKFTDYSARNTMLINQQNPEATLVASFGKWKKFGRFVEKGEKGIEILAPVTYKTNMVQEIERPALDEFGNQIYNSDGTEKMETVEKPMTGLSFKKAYVFDVSQTSGKELPDFISELSGDIDEARKEAVFAALKKVTKADFKFKDIQGGAKGFYNASKNLIVIKSGMSDAQTLKTAFHEAAHNLLHDPAKNIVTVKSPRNEKEVQAESVAFIVAEKFGLDTSDYSFPYIASWSDGKQLDQLKNALQEIQSAAKAISDELESELLKMQKRHLSMDEKLADEELNNIQKAEFLIEDCSDRGVNFSPEDTEKILEFAGDHEDIYETAQLVGDMENIQRQRDSYGYDFTYMIPIDTKEAALEAFDRGEAVYLLYPDNTEGQALDRSEIENFYGYFGIEKEPTADLTAEQDKNLIPVSKDVALEMWDKDLDVFIDGVMVENREDIVNAPDTAKIYLSEYQYTAQLEFENPKIENVNKGREYIGNTPYRELGDKSELQFYDRIRNRHAENIARQLDEDGVRYSGIKEEWTTTITINKADIPKYDNAVRKVIAGYEQNQAERFSPGKNNVEQDVRNMDRYGAVNSNVFGNTSYKDLGYRTELQYYSNLNNRHAENIAKQLNADGIRFSGVVKGDTTTITINKADIPAYEAAVAKVKASYGRDRSEPAPTQPPPRGQSFERNVIYTDRTASVNSNVIGNTAYTALGYRTELQYYSNLNNRHAENIAKQLNADGIRFSGVIKGDTTTITINKADIPAYEAAVAKVKASYGRDRSEPTPTQPPPRGQSFERNVVYADKPAVNSNIIGNTSYKDLGYRTELQYYSDLNNRHAENIAKQLNADGIRFSGVIKGDTTTITINKADIPAYEAAVAKVKASYDRDKPGYAPQRENNFGQNVVYADNPAPVNPNIIGNTPYAELGDKSELQYFTNLKNRHAENIAKQLEADGIRFSGMKKGTVTTITINKADIPAYEAAVAKVKASYDRDRENTAPAVKKPANIAKAIDNAISESNFELHRYHLDKAVASVIKEYGAEQVSKALAEYIVNHDYDGRISPANKAWARGIDFPQRQYAPVLQTHPAVLDGFINEARKQIKELELAPEAKLPSIYDDKFLHSTERVELRDDHRGIPETHHYMSSANEYMVDGIGWLDNASYDQEVKRSNLSPTDFYEKVSQINADYIDTQGSIGQMDMTKVEYTAMTDKTYSPENAVALEAAKAKLQERKNEAGVIEKPVEYYAVSQTSDRKFEISAMGADGVISTVKSNIPTVAEAKKAMVEIYESKKNSVRCELVHPQTLGEISADIMKNRSAQAHTINETAPQKSDKPKLPDFEIYQLKGGDENRDIRFISLEELAQQGLKPDFSKYEKTYEGDMSMLDLHSGKKIVDKLEAIYEKFNTDRPDDFMGHSLSVSDVVVMKGKPYYVDDIGFQPLKEFKPPERNLDKEKTAAAPDKDKPKPHRKPKL